MQCQTESCGEGLQAGTAGCHPGIGSRSIFCVYPPTDERRHVKTRKQKRAIEKSNAKQKELEKTISTLRGQLTRTQKKLAKASERAERWKAEARAHEKSASRANARAEKLHQKLDKASVASKPGQDTAAPAKATAPNRPVTEPTNADGVTVPDETWSVVQLKAEARARGLVGMSNKPKAHLLAALS